MNAGIDKMQMQIVVLLAKGDSKQSKIDLPNDDLDELATRLAKVLRKTKQPEILGSWELADKKVLSLWGYKEGRAGSENKHELPPPHDGIAIFGDAIITSSLDNKLQPLTTADYTKFYTQMFQGFDSGDDESDDDEFDEEELEEEADAIAEEEEEVVDDESDTEEENVVAESDSDTEVEKLAPVRAARDYTAAARNKKIPKWLSAQELEKEEYI